MGRHSSENTDVKLDTMILTYSRAKGAFLGMTFDGALVRADNNSRRAMYGPRVTTRATLLGRVGRQLQHDRSLTQSVEQKPKRDCRLREGEFGREALIRLRV